MCFAFRKQRSPQIHPAMPLTLARTGRQEKQNDEVGERHDHADSPTAYPPETLRLHGRSASPQGPLFRWSDPTMRATSSLHTAPCVQHLFKFTTLSSPLNSDYAVKDKKGLGHAPVLRLRQCRRKLPTMLPVTHHRAQPRLGTRKQE